MFKKNKLYKVLEPGIYKFFALPSNLELINIDTISRFLTIVNQEVLTKDNVALRFSYFIKYKITEGRKFIEKFDVFMNPMSPFQQAEEFIHNLSQIYYRDIISGYTSEELNSKRGEIMKEVPDGLKKELLGYGIEIEKLELRDLTFPKSIQDLFARELESKIRARADLDNARTAVATARTLKNAAKLIDNDENVKFIQYLETINRIASNGKHTFVIGGGDFIGSVSKK